MLKNNFLDRQKTALYIHWPFCLSKCPYCDFNSHVAAQIDEEQWFQAYQKELHFYHNLLGPRKIESIFFGGGTPSLMSAHLVERVLKEVDQLWSLGRDGSNYAVEITLEANPTSVESQKFQDFAGAGINRISLGIQALDEKDLKFLGRQHSRAQSEKAIETAQKYFSRFSLDFIYARPGQKPEEWQKELEQILAFGSSHLSLYQLTIERGTQFFTQYQRGDFVIPDEIQSTELYELTNSLCEVQGLHPYEISNYARIGQECQHNLIYWTYGDYIGIGPGAHGRVTNLGQKFMVENIKAPSLYLNQVHSPEHPNGSKLFDPINMDIQIIEKMMMGLRLYDGIDLASLEALVGKKYTEILDMVKVREFEEQALLRVCENRLKLSPSGILVLNYILSNILS